MVYKFRIIASYGRACSGGGRWAANIGTGRPGRVALSGSSSEPGSLRARSAWH